MDTVSGVKVAIQEPYCILCFMGIDDRDCGLRILPLDYGPILPLQACEDIRKHYYDSRPALLMHEICNAIVQAEFQRAFPTADLAKCMRAFALSFSFLWPATEIEVALRAQKICSQALAATIQRYTGMLGSPLAQSLAQLPAELLLRIGRFAYPSTLTRICTLLVVAKVLPSYQRSKKTEQTLRNIWYSPQVRTFLGQRYIDSFLFQDTEELLKANRRGWVHRGQGRRIVLVHDHVACIDMKTAIGVEGMPLSRPDLWYSVIEPSKANLCAYFKGNALRRICAYGVQVTQVLWDTPNPPRLPIETVYNFPKPDPGPTLPIRMRLLETGPDLVGITAVLYNGLTRSIFAHNGRSAQESRFYERAMQLRHPVMFIYLPFSPGERLVDVSIRGFCLVDFKLEQACVAVRKSTKPSLEADSTFVFGYYVPPARRAAFDFTSVTGYQTCQVSHLCVNERDESDHSLRLGVIRTISENEQTQPPADWWGADTPSLTPPSSVYEWNMMWMKVTVEDRECFQACLEVIDGQEYCIGLMFHGGSRAEMLGQWRWDRKITDKISLPTDKYGLGNLQDAGGYDRVKLHVCEAVPHDLLRIGGVLEWWCSAQRSRVGHSVAPST